MAVSLLLAMVVAAAHIGISVPVYRESKQATESINVYESNEFQHSVACNILGVYWKLNQSTQWRPSPYELYFSEEADEMLMEHFATYYAEDEGRDGDYYLREFKNGFNEKVMSQYSDFSSMWEHYRFYVQDAEGGSIYTNESQGLASLLGQSAGEKDMQDAFEYYIVMDFDNNGDMAVHELHGAEAQAVNAEYYYTNAFSSINGFSENFYTDFYSDIELPANFSMVLAVPAGMGDSFEIGSMKAYHSYRSNDELALIYIFALSVVLLAGVALSRVKRLQLGSFSMARIPMEVAVAVIICMYAFGSMFALNDLFMFNDAVGLDIGDLHVPAFALMAVFWLLESLCLLLAYFAAISLAQVFDMGMGKYLRERSWVVRAWHWVGRKIRQLFAWATSIDLTEPGNKSLLRIIGINFLVVSILCTVWVAGIAGVLIYSVILFYALDKYYKDLKGKFGRLLTATSGMAEGNLDIEIEEDLGPFNPLKEQLSKIREGFSTAVESETRSQNMKTELITNVSHDLKTPLTAIITYVDLLKDDSIDEQQRREYVDVLDKKSQRLKRLIEDLFEMSKAASGNVSVNYDRVDLPALIKQVESENRDVLDEAGIALVYKIHGDSHVLELDGEKTSRIFENLLHNIAKYSMPGTRAFVEMREQGGRMVTEMKNVSRAPLDFDAEKITERFIRGDQSRNTDGSGLGLAIAKSFTEVQGGVFWIETDGDLFKAVVSFAAN